MVPFLLFSLLVATSLGQTPVPSVSNMPSTSAGDTPAPSVSNMPSTSAGDTQAPSLSNAPSAGATNAPSLSNAPSASATLSPSLSNAPSAGATLSPSLSNAPSASATLSPSLSNAPSASATAAPSLSNAPSAAATTAPSLSIAPSTRISDAPSLTQTFASSGPPCPNDPNTFGFSTLDELRLAMQEEVNTIQSGGGTRRQPYVFVLCPGTSFNIDVEGEFVPILGNSIFSCGLPASSIHACIFEGGATQVRIQQSLITQIPFSMGISFQGVTFESFSESAVTVESPTAAGFESFRCIDCVFQFFQSTSVVDQLGDLAPTVIENSLVTNGAASNYFFGASNGGVLSVHKSTITSANAPVYISAMGLDTTAVIRETGILDNIGLATDFIAVAAQDGAIVDVVASTFARNTGMQVGVGAFSGSTVAVQNSTFIENSAVSPDARHAVVGVYNQSSLVIENSALEVNMNYLGMIFAIFESFVEATGVSIAGGQAIMPIFISELSSYAIRDTSATSFSAVICQPPPPNNIIFKEDSGSNCFVGNGNCFGMCLTSSDPTPAPSAGASLPVPATPTTGAPSAPCDRPINSFDVVVVVMFLGLRELSTQQQIQLIEETFLDAYNQLSFALHGVCDEDFREIVEVMARIGDPPTRRLSSHRNLQMPSYSVTFNVNGRCFGCDSSATLFIEDAGPTEEAFQAFFDGAIQDLRASNQLNDFVVTVTQVDEQTPDPVSTPTTRRTRGSRSKSRNSRSASASRSESSDVQEPRSRRSGMMGMGGMGMGGMGMGTGMMMGMGGVSLNVGTSNRGGTRGSGTLVQSLFGVGGRESSASSDDGMGGGMM